ncbi:LPXTG cell wall anchor domain-containing protein [Lentzea sp. NPDC034063]|uniref:LPXTG cell wall anchor domain-containing protein n=1 Tax=unclassified Lentzea TaxID=2643253 RepID=UPI0033E79796
MRLTPHRRSGLLASAALAAVASLVLGTSALADGVSTDDARAQPFLQFVDFNHPEACTVGGLTGTPIHPTKFTYTGGDNQQNLDITALPADFKVTGMVVRAGDVFNVYLAGKLGEALPWKGLRAPVLGDSTLPEIGEWFGCGVAVEKPPVTTTTTTTTTTTAKTSTQSPTSTTAPTSSAEVVVPTTTTTEVPVAQVAQTGGLAATGFGSAWLLGLGAALVAAGGAVLLVLRRRKV